MYISVPFEVLPVYQLFAMKRNLNFHDLSVEGTDRIKFCATGSEEDEVGYMEDIKSLEPQVSKLDFCFTFSGNVSSYEKKDQGILLSSAKALYKFLKS